MTRQGGRQRELVRRGGDAALGALAAPALAGVSDPQAFYTELGEEVAAQVEELAGDLAGEGRPGEGYLDRVARLFTARMVAGRSSCPRGLARTRGRGGTVSWVAAGPWEGLFWAG